jgi:hypothetical protein
VDQERIDQVISSAEEIQKECGGDVLAARTPPKPA